MDETVRRHIATLTILHAVCTAALDAFNAPDNLTDRELVADLEKMIERTRLAMDAFSKDV
jgi:hypothetical protein